MNDRVNLFALYAPTDAQKALHRSAMTLVERVGAVAAREERLCDAEVGEAIASAIGLSDDDCDTPAWAACYALAQALIDAAEAKATADRAEAAEALEADVQAHRRDVL